MGHTARRIWPRFGVALAALMVSACVGAVTIKTEVNAKPVMCGQLLRMIKAAGIPQMTDAQLCDFRLASLPPSKTEGFTFPHWQPLAVADAPAMFVRMVKGNRASNSVARQPDLVALRDAVVHSAQDHNLAFYTTTLPMDGRNITIVSMNIRRCSKLPYMDALDHPFYATYEQSDLRTPVPTNITIGGEELALWKGAVLVGIEVSNQWLLIGSPPATIGINLNNVWLSTGREEKGAVITGSTLCAFRIEK